MTTLSRPLDPAAVQAADDAFYAAHPEMAPGGNRIPLSATDPAQAAMRQEWVDLYVQNGGQVEGDEDLPPAKKPDDPVVPCDCPCDCAVVKLQYKLNGAWVDVPAAGFTDIGKDTSITFKAITSGGHCTPAKIVWGGDAGGSGDTMRVVFGTSGNRTVTVTCCESNMQVAVAVDPPNTPITIVWDPEGYSSFNVDDSSTTTERDFITSFTASADIDNNKWMFRVKEIRGGADIIVNYGGSRNAITNPPATELEAQDAVTVMKDYYTRGSRGTWHTEAASKTHEQFHFREWRETCAHYWPDAEVAIEKLETTYHDHPSEAAAVAALTAGGSGGTAKVTEFKAICRQYWFTLGDGASDRPYAAGQAGLNPAIQSVQALAAANGWTVAQGVDTPSVEPPCYQPWLPYNP